MTGAIEFLRKAKAICQSFSECDGNCPLTDHCENTLEFITDEANLVRKVMEYRLEDGNANTGH